MTSQLWEVILRFLMDKEIECLLKCGDAGFCVVTGDGKCCQFPVRPNLREAFCDGFNDGIQFLRLGAVDSVQQIT